MRYFYLSNKEVTEIDGSEAWAIVEELPNGKTHLYQIGFKNEIDAKETLKRVIAKYGASEE